MPNRFFSSVAIASDAVVLTGDEAHHLARVMRARVGDEIILFDGSGIDFLARIREVSKQQVHCDIIQRSPQPESAARLTLAVALPKGDRLHWLVEKCVELGVHTIVPLHTMHGVAEAGDAARERMRRWGIEACKQCARSRLLAIDEPATIAELLARDIPGNKFVAHPGGAPLRSLGPASELPPYTIVAAVGPEGGFAPEEIAQFTAAGWPLATLGPNILRVETATIAIAAWCLLVAE